MSIAPRITLVTEAYNLAEGQSEAAFLRALQAVDKIAAARKDVDVIVLDPSVDHLASPIVEAHFPHFSPFSVPGLSYDGQKNAAAQAARGEYLVFLDGDCTPVRDTWLDEITLPLSFPHVHAVAGLTLYDDFSLTGKAMSVLDFGFLFEARRGAPLGCYASNNVAFRLATYLKIPAPDDGLLRSYCYKHAQLMLRAKVPVFNNPRAFAVHELPNVEKERLRRGYDHVAALWSDPALPLASQLEASEGLAHHILQENFDCALLRMLQAPPELGIRVTEHSALAAEIRKLMQIDKQGVLDALAEGARTGRNEQTREIHRSLKLTPKPNETLLTD